MGIPPYFKEFCDASKGTIDEKNALQMALAVHVGGELSRTISMRSGVLQGFV